MIAALAGSLALLALFYAWRYAQKEIDPDWAMFNLAAFTGSIYGRDFLDCKTPGVHVWFWLLAHLVGKDIRRIKFLHHLLIGLAGVGFFLQTGNFFGALVFVVVVNSGWLLAFHGNVGAVPAALILLAMGSGQGWIAAACLLAAVLYEPKLLPSVAVLCVRWPIEGMVMAGLALLGWGMLLAFDRTRAQQIWESSVIVGARMAKARRGYTQVWVPWFTAQGLLYALPWVIFAVQARPEFMYWLPVLLFALVTGAGGVIRENHLLPLAPWVAAAGIAPEVVLALWAVDWLSAGFYLGDIWSRFYLGLRDRIYAAREAGEWLRDQPGTIWVNGIHTEVYVHARKPVPYGMAEQIEIREVATERRAAMLEVWQLDPPDWVVTTMDPALRFSTTGYQAVWSNSLVKIWKRVTYADNSQNSA